VSVLPRRRTRRRALALAAIATAVAIALAELLLPLVLPNARIGYYWAFDPLLGWSQVPGGKSRTEIDGETVRIEFNGRGFHDVQHELARPAGVRRIVLVGDSFSEAVQVNLEDAFFRLLEARLDAESGSDFEVVNLGVGDFGTAQECLAFEHLGLAYDPEILLVQIFPLNDVANNSLELFDTSGSDNDALRPYFVERGGALELTSAQPVRNWLRRHSATVRSAEAVLWKLFGTRSDERREADRRARAAQLGFPPEGLPPLFHVFADDAHQHPAVRRAWDLTERILERIATTARAHGVKVLFVVVPWDQCVGSAWEAFAAGQPPPPLRADHPEQRLGAWCARHGVPCLLLKPIFDRRASEFFPARRGHFNPAAHRMTAEAIFAKLQAEGMLEKD
jgi:hypothetical protein